jgi:hypothetical protein
MMAEQGADSKKALKALPNGCEQSHILEDW